MSNEEKQIQEIEKYITQNKKRVSSNKIIFEQYFLGHSIQAKKIEESIKQKIQKQRQNRTAKELQKIKTEKSTFQYPRGPKKDDEDKEKEHPNGIYKEAPYHHKNSTGQKSPAPKDGQAALDNSVQIKPTSPRRIGASRGELVILV